jgi:hypothetical protein
MGAWFEDCEKLKDLSEENISNQISQSDEGRLCPNWEAANLTNQIGLGGSFINGEKRRSLNYSIIKC